MLHFMSRATMKTERRKETGTTRIKGGRKGKGGRGVGDRKEKIKTKKRRRCTLVLGLLHLNSTEDKSYNAHSLFFRK